MLLCLPSLLWLWAQCSGGCSYAHQVSDNNILLCQFSVLNKCPEWILGHTEVVVIVLWVVLTSLLLLSCMQYTLIKRQMDVTCCKLYDWSVMTACDAAACINQVALIITCCSVHPAVWAALACSVKLRRPWCRETYIKSTEGWHCDSRVQPTRKVLMTCHAVFLHIMFMKCCEAHAWPIKPATIAV